MATIQDINVSTPNDGNGDTLRGSQIKVNDNFDELNAKKVEVVAGKDLSSNDFTDIEKTKLSGIEESAQVNVQADWLQDDNLQPDFIKNKPTEDFLNAVGSLHYTDLVTQTTPIVVVANVEKKLTNDTLGLYTDTANAPFGVSNLWNPTTNQMNFSELNVGDWVDFRPDINVNLDGINTTFKLYAKMGIGSGAEWTLNINNSERKSTDEFNETSFIGFDIANLATKDFPAEIFILTDAGATVKVNGWLFRVIRKNINIVDIQVNFDNNVYANIVYVNHGNPNSATIFDDVNPPVVNDNALKINFNNLYIGLDASIWLWNGVSYVSKSIRESSNFWISGTSLDAGKNKASAIDRMGTIKAPKFISTDKLADDIVLGTGDTSKLKTINGSSILGSGDIVISGGGLTDTDALPEGSTNLYFTTARVLATLLTGISFITGGAIVSTDSVLEAFGKIQKQINDGFTTANIKSLLGITTLSGSNTGDQQLILPVTETGTSFSLTDAYNGKVVILTASCTVTIPNGLIAGFEVSIVTLAGVTATIALGGSVVLFNNTGTTMAEKLSFTLKNRTATNNYITSGNL